MQEQLQQAIQLAQSGQRDQARILLREIVGQHPNIEAAWLWLASVAITRDERVNALRRVLGINPANQDARAALIKLGEQPPEFVVATPATQTAPPPDQSGWSNLTLLETGAVVFGIVLVLGTMLFLAAGGSELIVPDPTSTLIPTATFTRIPSETPIPSPTRPTVTPGPSPTPLVLPPTWTPSATFTQQPSRTPAPTITPYPSRTRPPTQTRIPPSNTPEPTEALPTRTPRPTRTVAPEVTEEVTAEVTQEVTTEATAEITAEVTAEATERP